MKERIYYTKPSITELEIRYATDAATNGWGMNCYDYIVKFEESFKKHLGVQYAIATSSCTGALHMGLAALDIAPGDEIILADINWIASAAPITYLKATPVFVDILPDTWCLDPEKVKEAITQKTKAIIAVHLYGNLCDMDHLYELSEQYGIPVIEDAAEAIGSQWHGKRAGAMGTFGVFSFHGTKTITTGESGMFVTDDEKLFEKVLTLSNHGRARGQVKMFWPDMVGYKYKMSNVQAAIGCAQMERIEELIAKKRDVFKAYEADLAGLPLEMNPEYPETVNGYWMPTIVVNEEVNFNRGELIESFKKENIDGREFFWPLSSLPFFQEPISKFNNSYSIYHRALNLPSYHDMTLEEISRVTDTIKSFISA